MDVSPSTPRETYLARLASAREAESALNRRDETIANLRLAAFVAGLVLAWMLYVGYLARWSWLLIPVGLFAVCIVAHDRLARAKARAARRSAFFELGLARLEDRWAGLGASGERFLHVDHPYAADLDLFGKGSIFQRITAARTRSGEAVLASWLLAPAEPNVIIQRQKAVAELRPDLDFREDLARLGDDARGAFDLEALAEWAEAPRAEPLIFLRITALILAILGILALLAWSFTGLGYLPLVVVLALDAGFAGFLRWRFGDLPGRIEKAAYDLGRLEGMLDRIEQRPCQAALLTALKSSLVDSSKSASKQVLGLRRRSDLFQWGHNLFFAPAAVLLLWSVQVSLAVESWRGRSGKSVARWAAALAEFEALCSLAGFAYENPADPFPEILADGPRVEAEAMGHPLLPTALCIRNNLSLGGELRVLVVSGSNMSGKSTLLRSLGANVALALAGGPVRASKFAVSPMIVGATLRVEDSLQEGKSRFYAEILRLKLVVELARGSLPLLFLLDEVLSGTNSHDRLQGASAIVRGLIDRGAIGLMTTHDLALAEVAEQLAPRARNVHFQDHMEDGIMRFDYQMRPGIVQVSNALALMRAVGLEV